MSDPVYTTQAELDEALGFFSRHFAVARIVNPILTNVMCCQCSSPADCYEVWNKTERCRNCISARVLMTGEPSHKLERIVGSEDIYLVTSSRVVIPDGAAVLELVSIMEHDFEERYAQDVSDITSLEELNVMVFQDPLTGIFNRRYAEEHVNSTLESHGHEDVVLFALMDIDNLKHANDAYGHTVGDALINEVVSRALQALSIDGEDQGFLGRIGGDEFMIMLHVPNRACGLSLFEHVMVAVRCGSVEGAPDLTPTVCIGAMFSDERELRTFEEVLAGVDERLYIAKNLGKNQVVGSDGPVMDPPCDVEGERRKYRRDAL